jgi:hypothetical protein
LESGANDVAVPCESLLTCLMYCLCSDWSDTTLLFARCLGMMIVIEEVKGAMIEAEVEVEVEVEVGVTVVAGAAVVAGEETEGLMLEPLGYTWAAFPPGREAGIWKTSSPSMGGMGLYILLFLSQGWLT